MDGPRDASQWTRDEKIRYLNSIVDDENEEKWLTDAFPNLQTLIDDLDPEVRRLAVTGMWDYPRPQIIDRLFDLALHDPEQEVRSRAVQTLGRFIYEGEINIVDLEVGFIAGPEEEIEDQLSKEDFSKVKDFLVGLTGDESQPLDTRRFAVEAIGFLGASEARDIIVRAYEHPDLNMKVSAIFAMGRNGGVDWSEILLKELNSPVRELQYEATRAAGEAYLEAASPILKRLARSDDADLKLEAIFSLGKVGGPGARRFLEQLTRSRDSDVREVAEAALDELELNEAIDEDNDAWDDVPDEELN